MIKRILQNGSKFSKRTLKERNLAVSASANPKMLHKTQHLGGPEVSKKLLSFADKIIQSSLKQSAYLTSKVFSKEIEKIPTRNGYGEGLVEAGKKDKIFPAKK